MSTAYTYSINLENKFGFLNLINAPTLASKVKEQWFNQTLCQVNDCVVRLGVMQGEFHWHKHDLEDEFFFVLEGELLIDLEDGSQHFMLALPITIVNDLEPTRCHFVEESMHDQIFRYKRLLF
jgi:hypothetical protein